MPFISSIFTRNPNATGRSDPFSYLNSSTRSKRSQDTTEQVPLNQKSPIGQEKSSLTDQCETITENNALSSPKKGRA